MQLEEKRRAIEAQKKKMEALSAQQRLKLGKAAFLHVVKKDKNMGELITKGFVSERRLHCVNYY
uniref:Uncharacterized protein n=1 Tax=Mus spicilegus TaxID=10103 RepID=A0A8C6I9H4_MUSSI